MAPKKKISFAELVDLRVAIADLHDAALDAQLSDTAHLLERAETSLITHLTHVAVVAHPQTADPIDLSRHASLNELEVRVLGHVKDGYSYAQIGTSLGISAHTVNYAMSCAMRKLGVTEKLAAIVEAVRRGVITLE